MYYHNKVEIKGIDPRSLWKLEKGFFVLVDNDQYLAIAESEREKFYRVCTIN